MTEPTEPTEPGGHFVHWKSNLSPGSHPTESENRTCRRDWICALKRFLFSFVWLCIKVGRGQGDGDIATRVWGLGTRGRETRDLRTSSMERGDVWDGDAGTSNTGTQGTQDVNDSCKSRW